MFKWTHGYSIEVDLPLKTVWDFYVDPNNLPKFTDVFESCSLDGEFKTGATIKAKIKNKNAFLKIIITGVKPYQECGSLFKGLLVSQETWSIFKEVSPGRTQINVKTCLISFLVPFIKNSFLLNQLEKVRANCTRTFAELSEKPIAIQLP